MRSPRCPTCRYDLSGHAEATEVRCPECGSVHRWWEIRAPHPFPWAAAASATVPWLFFGAATIVLPFFQSPQHLTGFIPGIALAVVVVSVLVLVLVTLDAIGRDIRYHKASLAAFALALNGLPVLAGFLISRLLG